MELPSFYRIFFHIILQPLQGRRFALGKYAHAMALLVAASVATPAHAYTLLQLKRDVASFLAEEYSQHTKVDISVGKLDRRMRIGGCNQALTMNTQDSSGLGGNITVNVRCKGRPAWSVHVPAQVYIFAKVPVAARPLNRGDLVSSGDIGEDTLNISLIRQDFIASPAVAIGQEVKRNINQGEPLRSAYLDAPTAIKRGDMITLASGIGGIRVVTTATAMSDGRIGQKIRVRNTQSTRVVSARVTGSGQAQTE